MNSYGCHIWNKSQEGVYLPCFPNFMLKDCIHRQMNTIVKNMRSRGLVDYGICFDYEHVFRINFLL